MPFSRSFIVPSPMFKYLSQFKFIFVHGVRCFITLIYMKLSNFPSTTWWKDCIFPILNSFLLCQGLLDHRCVGLFLGSLFCSIDQHVSLISHCFYYYGFTVLSEVWENYASCFLFFFFFPLRTALTILSLLWIHINFRIICSCSVKIVMVNLIEIVLNL